MAMHRSVLWSAISLAFAGLAAALIHEQSTADRRKSLRGKVVLITGGSRGLGFALARELAALGCRLVLISRKLDELERAKAQLGGADVFLRAADVSKPDQIRSAVDEATIHFGQIDIVMNNAGIILVGPLESQQLASFQHAMEINFFGALHTTLSVLPQMLKRGEGAVVNIASIGGRVAFPHLLPYVASKFALAGWSQGLRAELAGRGIHVTTVIPGIMRTGSHIQARYTGNAVEEYRWFATAASFPGTATSAKAAARRIVNALVSNEAEVSIGLQAIVASHVANLAPEWTAAGLSLANHLLPNGRSGADPQFWIEDQSQAGHVFRGSLPEPLERLGTAAIQQYNQH
jgi:short-subunit dehydrogenase